MLGNNPELDDIQHLLEIEKSATSILDEAKKEADKRLIDANSKYNTEYKKSYDKISSQLEKKFNEDFDAISNKYRGELESYKAAMEEKKLNEKEFSSLLEKLIVG